MKNFISKRGQVSNFIVMDLFEKANNISKQGRKIYHFEAGQPTAKLPKKCVTIIGYLREYCFILYKREQEHDLIIYKKHVLEKLLKR